MGGWQERCSAPAAPRPAVLRNAELRPSKDQESPGTQLMQLDRRRSAVSLRRHSWTGGQQQKARHVSSCVFTLDRWEARGRGAAQFFLSDHFRAAGSHTMPLYPCTCQNKALPRLLVCHRPGGRPMNACT